MLEQLEARKGKATKLKILFHIQHNKTDLKRTLICTLSKAVYHTLCIVFVLVD